MNTFTLLIYYSCYTTLHHTSIYHTKKLSVWKEKYFTVIITLQLFPFHFVDTFFHYCMYVVHYILSTYQSEVILFTCLVCLTSVVSLLLTITSGELTVWTLSSNSWSQRHVCSIGIIELCHQCTYCCVWIQITMIPSPLHLIQIRTNH